MIGSNFNSNSLRIFEVSILASIKGKKRPEPFDKAIASVKTELERHEASIKARCDELLNDPRPIESKIADYDQVNSMHDDDYELEKLIERILSAKQTRNWSSADWGAWDLVVDNID